MASNKDPYSCNATWWDAEVNRVDISSTMGNVCMALFEALPADAQAVLLSNLTQAHNNQLARDIAKNTKGSKS